MNDWMATKKHVYNTIEQQSAYLNIKLHNSRHKGIYNNEKKMIEGTGAVYKARNIHLTDYYKKV